MRRFMNLRQIRKDVEKLKRDTTATRIAEAERFEVFVELCRQGGINLSREQLKAQYDYHKALEQRLISEGKIVPSEMTTLERFIVLSREAGTDLTDEQLKAQFEAMNGAVKNRV